MKNENNLSKNLLRLFFSLVLNVLWWYNIRIEEKKWKNVENLFAYIPFKRDVIRLQRKQQNTWSLKSYPDV